MKDNPSKPWPNDFPKVTTVTDYKKMKQHSDYDAAKTGDNEAAIRLIHSLVSVEKNSIFSALAKKYPNALLVGIHAEEDAGKNKIPQVLAEYIGKITGLEVDEKILQSNIVSHTGAGQNVRLFIRPEFDGNVQSGRDYIVVDDMVTMGSTLGELRYYIESHSGNVVDVVTLSTQHENNKTIALAEETKLVLADIFGVKSINNQRDMSALNNFLKESDMYGGNYENLTESEARALIHIKTLDEARNRRSAARQTGNVGVCEKTIRRDGNQKNSIKENQNVVLR
ncbi:MAG: phosphoribosyltransferase [Synergistaceae bacterium]|jgi:hypoxanthine phosphoribosyltransferase|nr:phosphoribosyltransferase [Synergistaceae bacterium]